MSTYEQHRTKALDTLDGLTPGDPGQRIALAGVHSTLALAAATEGQRVTITLEEYTRPIDLVPVTARPWSVYVASSWRNEGQGMVVDVLRGAGLEVYDFKNPPGGTGFAWSEVGLDQNASAGLVDAAAYLEALEHPRVIAGYGSDYAAMQDADTFVLVLPCGRSAHLELGWAVGAGKRTAILLGEGPVVPELMYRMVDYVAPTLVDLMAWLDDACGARRPLRSESPVTGSGTSDPEGTP